MTFKRNAIELDNNCGSEKETLQKGQQIITPNPYGSRFHLCKICCCLLLGFIALLLGLLSFKYTLFDICMSERLRMTPGLPPFEWWVNPKPEVLCRTYIFAVTNSEEFLSGSDDKLKLKEIGPIVYRETLQHSDIEFHTNSTLSYTLKREVEYLPELNEPDILNQTIIVPNVVLLGMAAIANSYSISVKFGFNMISKSDPLFLNTTVYNYLWNLTTPALETVKRYVPFMVPQDNGGVMYNVYHGYEDRVNVKIGEKHGFDQFFMINTYKGRPTVPGYKPERGDCFNSVENSTEGALYPNFLTKDTVLRYWRKTVCKVVPLHFEKELYKGPVKAYKYIARPSIYDRLDNLTADCNRGIGNIVLPSGLSDCSKCYHDLPVAVSCPHFYGRKGYWNDQLEGFSPSKDKHGSYTILEPQTGVPLEQIARSQSNLIIPKLRNFNSHVNRFSEMVVPMGWMEYHQLGLTDEIYAMLVFTVNILPYLQYVISVIITLTGVFYLHAGVSRVKTVFKVKKLSSLSPLNINRQNKS